MGLLENKFIIVTGAAQGIGFSAAESILNEKANVLICDVDRVALEISEHEDWTGNPITRLKIKIDPERCFANAWEISSRLKNLNPSIVVRDDLIENQEFFLDPCNINHDEIGLVSDSIIKVLNDFTNDPERKKETWSEVKSTREKNILS